MANMIEDDFFSIMEKYFSEKGPVHHQFESYEYMINYLIQKIIDETPSINIETVKLDHINTYRKLQGKGEWQDITITLYDPIVPSGAQQVMEWVRLGYESLTGRKGYADFYKKDIDFYMLGPVGDKIEQWKLKGAFIASANFSDLDFSSNDPAEIELTLAYDYAILEF